MFAFIFFIDCHLCKQKRCAFKCGIKMIWGRKALEEFMGSVKGRQSMKYKASHISLYFTTWTIIKRVNRRKETILYHDSVCRQMQAMEKNRKETC